MMLLLLDMLGILLGFPFIVPVVQNLQLSSILFPVIKGAFLYNETCDLTANLLAEVGHEVQVEPHLQPISGEQFPLASSNVNNVSCLDIPVNGFWAGRQL